MIKRKKKKTMKVNDSVDNEDFIKDDFEPLINSQDTKPFICENQPIKFFIVFEIIEKV